MRFRPPGASELTEAIAAAALDAILVIDDTDRLVYANHAFEALLGHDLAAMYGERIHDRIAPERYRSAFREGMRRFREQGDGPVVGETTEVQALHRDGHEITVELSISSLVLDGRWYAVGVLRDVSERKRAQAALEARNRDLEAKNRELTDLRNHLEYLASHDPLTGVYNRARMSEVMTAAWSAFNRHGAAFCLVLLDLDHFKEVNDRRGHAHGDALLQRVSSRLRGMLRAEDQLARWGGEEFLLLAAYTECAGAVELAERIRGAIEALTPETGHAVSASIGVAAMEPGLDLDTLTRRADAAMYAAKRAGRNRVRLWDEGIDPP